MAGWAAIALTDIRPRHVYVAAATAFVLLAGYEGARMAAGHDPALASSRPTPAPAAQDPPWPDDHDRFDPGDQGGVDPGAVPQPESRLS